MPGGLRQENDLTEMQRVAWRSGDLLSCAGSARYSMLKTLVKSSASYYSLMVELTIQKRLQRKCRGSCVTGWKKSSASATS